MKKITRILTITLYLTVLVSIGLVITTTESLAQTINACYSDRNGALRIVVDSSACSKSETYISWNQAGPSGPQGPAGPTGPTGATGPAGVANGITRGNPRYCRRGWGRTPWDRVFRNTRLTQ